MERCPRCSKIVEANQGYCPVCNRPRILESLQTPIVQPAWQQRVWQLLIALVTLWLVLTVCVAFLREAKAVRDSRVFLTEGKNQEAWERLKPFLADHPDDGQGLLLCGKATIRLGLREEPMHCLQHLRAVSPDLNKELRADYGQILTEQVRQLSCDAGIFDNLLSWGDQLGASFAESVTAGLDGMIDSCHSAQKDGELKQIAKSMTEKGQAKAMAERGYAPAITRAIAQSRYQEAMVFAQQAADLGEAGKKAVEAALAPERRKVTATVQAIRSLRDRLKADPANQSNYAWCFPAGSPEVVQAARDGWGREIFYRPLGDQYGTVDKAECYGGFTVISYGADGVETENDWNRSPNAEISCQTDSCSFPNGFWWSEAE